MQNAYVGDIGDYGKYTFLRAITAQLLSLAVNWYCVVPEGKQKQNDGKFVSYLENEREYRDCDTALFDALKRIVAENDRRLQRVEEAALFPAVFYSEKLTSNRAVWHRAALERTKAAEVVFLDPDNGLATERMHEEHCATDKHVLWQELKDYYDRGQSVVLYQHRPQGLTKDECIAFVLRYQRDWLRADRVLLMEFSRYTNRFYFVFAHWETAERLENACAQTAQRCKVLCRKIEVNEIEKKGI